MRVASCELSGRSGHDAAWALLAQVYREETGEPLPQVGVTVWGRPYFVDSPYFFSLSHTPHHAFCALGRKPVGIDAEELTRQVMPGLAHRILSPTEHRQYESAVDKARAFLTFWVLKEAAAKLDGKGLRGFPNHTSFRLEDPRVREINGCLVAVLTEDAEYVV